MWWIGPSRIRTCDHPLRRRVLYPLSYRSGIVKSMQSTRDMRNKHEMIATERLKIKRFYPSRFLEDFRFSATPASFKSRPRPVAEDLIKLVLWVYMCRFSSMKFFELSIRRSKADNFEPVKNNRKSSENSCIIFERIRPIRRLR